MKWSECLSPARHGAQLPNSAFLSALRRLPIAPRLLGRFQFPLSRPLSLRHSPLLMLLLMSFSSKWPQLLVVASDLCLNCVCLASLFLPFLIACPPLALFLVFALLFCCFLGAHLPHRVTESGHYSLDQWPLYRGHLLFAHTHTYSPIGVLFDLLSNPHWLLGLVLFPTHFSSLLILLFTHPLLRARLFMSVCPMPIKD